MVDVGSEERKRDRGAGRSGWQWVIETACVRWSQATAI